MEFSQRKLPKEAAPNLRICPIQSVRAFALMLAPVYVYMEKNEKFVAVKAPLDFFTPEELERLKPFQKFFLPEFVDHALPYREAGRSVRALLLWERDGGNLKEATLAPAPYEVSDATFRIIASLWGEGTRVEPFFIATFVNELCDVLDGALLKAARDLDVKRYEEAVFLSSWSVFLSLHLGRCSLEYLNCLRLAIFRATVSGETPVWREDEVELIELARASLEAGAYRSTTGDFFDSREERLAQRLSSRMRRVKGVAANG
jgi:hypothetical protein